MRRQILYAQANHPEHMMGFYFDEFNESNKSQQWTKTFDDMEVTITRSFVFGKPGPGYGIIIYTQTTNKFLLIGTGFQVKFRSTNPKSTFTGILSAKEKEVKEDGELTTLRVLNGDETRSGAYMIMPGPDPDYGGFPIRVTIPARTCIAEVEVYSLEERSEHY